MKLVLVTVVDEYKNEVFKLFKESGITSFSKLDIEGFKTLGSLQMSTNWFASERSGADSEMFFSFTEEEHIDKLFIAIETFNNSLGNNNPVRAVVVPVERYI